MDPLLDWFVCHYAEVHHHLQLPMTLLLNYTRSDALG